MKNTKDLFVDSIEQYKKLIQKTTELNDKMVSLSPAEILKECEQLHELQTKQAKIDTFLIEIMQDTGPEILNMPYTGEYQQQLDKAIHSCNKVAAKAQTIRTLLQTEMQKLKQGQKGLSGYTAITQGSKTNLAKHY